MTNCITADKKNKVKLLICYHKPFHLFKDEVLTPIHVGRANAIKRMNHESENFKWLIQNMIGDDTGDNISEKNDFYNEMTAIYWAWKNYDELGNPDYISLMHYRRHFIFDEQIKDVINVRDFHEDSYLDFLNYSVEEISDFVDGYDFIPHIGHVHNVYEHYIQNQRKEDIDLANKIVLEMYPEYEKSMKEYYAGEYSNFCNMCIFSKELFFEYCEWIFAILQEFENRVDMSQKRFFISERLTGLFIYHLMQKEELKYKTLPIAFIDEPTKVPIALYADEEEPTTTAIDIMSILQNKDDYSFYDLHIFCKNSAKSGIEAKLKQYLDPIDQCSIDVIGVEESPDILPLYLEKYLPKVNKCIYISGKVLTLHDLGEFYRICSVDDYLAVGIPLVYYDPAMKDKRIKSNLIVLNLKRMRQNRILEKLCKNQSGNDYLSVLNEVLSDEIGYIPDYFFVSEHLANYKTQVLSQQYRRADIQAGVLWHKFMVYDDIEPEFNCQGIYSQFWWDYLRKLPFEYQKLDVSLESLKSLMMVQQKEINLFDRYAYYSAPTPAQEYVLETIPENTVLVEETFSENPKMAEEWRNYSFFGKLKFYYDNNGMKQTLKYACQKLTKGGK